MNNILFVGPYREFTGIGNASRKYIEALSVAGYNVAARPIFNTIKPVLEQQLSEAVLRSEKNKSDKYDTIIQHGYPHQFCYHQGYKNIGIIHIESTQYGFDIYEYLNHLDEIWVGSTVSKNELIRLSLDEKKIKIVPEFIDLNIVETYKNKHSREHKDKFMFYVIADFIDKKNLPTIILAFFILSIEFPDIGLLIKTKNAHNDSSNLSEVIKYDIDKIIQNLRLNIDKNETYPVLIIGETKYENILYIHNNCDCYIDISSGESFGYPVLEAMAFNNQIIVNKNIGSCDTVRGTKFYGVDSQLKYCNDASSPYWIYNSINQQWYDPELGSLIIQMKRAITESSVEKKDRIETQNNKILNYSIDNIKAYL